MSNCSVQCRMAIQAILDKTPLIKNAANKLLEENRKELQSPVHIQNSNIQVVGNVQNNHGQTKSDSKENSNNMTNSQNVTQNNCNNNIKSPNPPQNQTPLKSNWQTGGINYNSATIDETNFDLFQELIIQATDQFARQGNIPIKVGNQLVELRTTRINDPNIGSKIALYVSNQLMGFFQKTRFTLIHNATLPKMRIFFWNQILKVFKITAQMYEGERNQLFSIGFQQTNGIQCNIEVPTDLHFYPLKGQTAMIFIKEKHYFFRIKSQGNETVLNKLTDWSELTEEQMEKYSNRESLKSCRYCAQGHDSKNCTTLQQGPETNWPTVKDPNYRTGTNLIQTITAELTPYYPIPPSPKITKLQHSTPKSDPRATVFTPQMGTKMTPYGWQTETKNSAPLEPTPPPQTFQQEHKYEHYMTRNEPEWHTNQTQATTPHPSQWKLNHPQPPQEPIPLISPTQVLETPRWQEPTPANTEITEDWYNECANPILCDSSDEAAANLAQLLNYESEESQGLRQDQMETAAKTSLEMKRKTDSNQLNIWESFEQQDFKEGFNKYIKNAGKGKSIQYSQVVSDVVTNLCGGNITIENKQARGFYEMMLQTFQLFGSNGATELIPAAIELMVQRVQELDQSKTSTKPTTIDPSPFSKKKVKNNKASSDTVTPITNQHKPLKMTESDRAKLRLPEKGSISGHESTASEVTMVKLSDEFPNVPEHIQYRIAEECKFNFTMARYEIREWVSQTLAEQSKREQQSLSANSNGKRNLTKEQPINISPTVSPVKKIQAVQGSRKLPPLNLKSAMGSTGNNQN